MATNTTPTLCYQANGGTCKNKVSANNGYVCSAGHRHSQIKPTIEIAPLGTSPVVNISKLSIEEKTALAQDETIDLVTQLALAKDKSDRVRYCLARNPSLTEDLQRELENDAYGYIHSALAQNLSLTEDLQMKLAESPDKNVRQYLAKNTSIAEETQRKLAKDKNEAVRQFLARRISLSESSQRKLAKDESENVRKSLASNCSLIEELQRELVKDKWQVRKSLASNCSLIEELQVKLAGDKSAAVRQTLAENTSLTEELQVKLAGDTDDVVRYRLAWNSSLVGEVAKELASMGHSPYGIARDKSISELWERKSLVMAGDHQSQFGEAFLSRLVGVVYVKPEDGAKGLSEQRKLLILLAFDKFAKDKGEGNKEVSSYRDAILKIYPGDQEIAYLIGG